jgi:hypothetical protein
MGNVIKLDVEMLLKKFEERAEWTHERCLVFHVCYITNETIWPFTKAYKGTATQQVAGYVSITQWCSEKGMVLRKLKANI